MKNTLLTLTKGAVSGLLVSSIILASIYGCRSLATADSQESIPKRDETTENSYYNIMSSSSPSDEISSPFDWNLDFSVNRNLDDEAEENNKPGMLDDKCHEVIDKIITADMISSLEKVKAVHDYLITNTEFDMSPTNYQHDTYSTLTDGLAVCSGYASAFKAILDRLGIPCEIIITEDGEHVFNAVRLNDEPDNGWYYIDVTWDDNGRNKDAEEILYGYFMLPYSEMSQYQDFEDKLMPEGSSCKYRDWAINQVREEKRTDFYNMLERSEYSHFIEVSPYEWELDMALKNLADSGHISDGCVIAYYGNTQDSHYPTSCYLNDGTLMNVNIQEWAFDYYYMLLTFDTDKTE